MIPDLVTDGFTINRGVLTASEQKLLIEQLGPVSGAGRRGMLALPEVSRLARSDALLDLVGPHLPAGPRPVRAIYFDKSPDANWLVPWHQDLTLAVQQKLEHPGFGPWSMKDGVIHVQPPAVLLEQMLTVRLHLDAAGETNGALRVLPGSHTRGRLTAEQIQEIRSVTNEHLCCASAGDALLMRPLLLHASGRSTAGAPHRRVLHIEYSGCALPAGLEWNEAA